MAKIHGSNDHPKKRLIRRIIPKRGALRLAPTIVGRKYNASTKIPKITKRGFMLAPFLQP